MNGGLNTYGYVFSNPTRWIDRYGLETATSSGTIPHSGGRSGVGTLPAWARSPAGFAAWAATFSKPAGLGSDIVPIDGKLGTLDGIGDAANDDKICLPNGSGDGCAEWKERLLALADNIQMLESITGKINDRRAEYTAGAKAYNKACAKKTGPIPEHILTLLD